MLKPHGLLPPRAAVMHYAIDLFHKVHRKKRMKAWTEKLGRRRILLPKMPRNPKMDATETTNVDHPTAWGHVLFENLLSKLCKSCVVSQPWNFRYVAMTRLFELITESCLVKAVRSRNSSHGHVPRQGHTRWHCPCKQGFDPILSTGIVVLFRRAAIVERRILW